MFHKLTPRNHQTPLRAADLLRTLRLRNMSFTLLLRGILRVHSVVLSVGDAEELVHVLEGNTCIKRERTSKVSVPALGWKVVKDLPLVSGTKNQTKKNMEKQKLPKMR